MKQILAILFFIFSVCAYSNYEDIDQEALPIDYESLHFNQDELRQALNNEMDFIESKNQDVTLYLEKNIEQNNSQPTENVDEVNVTSSAIKREPAIKDFDQEDIDDEELSTLFESETPTKARRIRSR